MKPILKGAALFLSGVAFVIAIIMFLCGIGPLGLEYRYWEYPKGQEWRAVYFKYPKFELNFSKIRSLITYKGVGGIQIDDTIQKCPCGP